MRPAWSGGRHEGWPPAAAWAAEEGRAKEKALFRELRIAAVPRGFRSSFRDWAAERTDDAPHAVMEAAQAHAVRNVEAPTPAPACSNAATA